MSRTRKIVISAVSAAAIGGGSLLVTMPSAQAASLQHRHCGPVHSNGVRYCTGSITQRVHFPHYIRSR